MSMLEELKNENYMFLEIIKVIRSLKRGKLKLRGGNTLFKKGRLERLEKKIYYEGYSKENYGSGKQLK